MSAPPTTSQQTSQPYSGSLAPNVIRGSGIIRREQLIKEQTAERNRQLELDRIAHQKKLDEEKRRRNSGGGSLPSWLRQRRQDKADAEQKAQDKKDKQKARDAEQEAVFNAYRQADAKANAEGYDLNSATFRVTQETTTAGEALKQLGDPKGGKQRDGTKTVNKNTGEVREQYGDLSAYDTLKALDPSTPVTVSNLQYAGGDFTLNASSKKQLAKEAEKQGIFSAYRELDDKAKAQGGDLSGASFRVTGGQQGNVFSNKKVKVTDLEFDQGNYVTDLKNERLQTNIAKNTAGIFRSQQIDTALEDVRPEYRDEARQTLYGENAKLGRTDQIFDDASLKEFASGFNFAKDVETGRGASDDVVYGRKGGILGAGGVVEGKDDFGFFRSGQFTRSVISVPVVGGKSSKETLADMNAKAIGLDDDPVKAFTTPFENFYTQFIAPATVGTGLGIGALFGGKAENLNKRADEVGKESEALYKPEIEGEFYSRVGMPTFEAGAVNLSRQLSGQRNDPATRNRFSQQFGSFSSRVGEEFAQRPASAVANLSASAILFVPDKIFRGGAKLVEGLPKALGIAGKVAKGGKGIKGASAFETVGTKGSFDTQAKEARIAMGLESASKAKTSRIDFVKNSFSLFGKQKKPEVKFTKISDQDFAKIQAERSDSSIYKNWVNYEQADDVRDIARTFDQANPPRNGTPKPEDFGLDEVTITKEFERAPVGRFVEQKRPAVLGQKEAVSIDEELNIVKLNPSKPTRAKSLSEIMKSDLWTGEALKTAGAPFKQTQERSLPKLGDMLKPNVAGLDVTDAEARIGNVARAEASVYPNVTPSGKPLKNLSDILKPDVAGLGVTEKEARIGDVARSEASAFANMTPSGKKVKRLGDIIKSDLFTPSKGVKGSAFKQTGTASYDYALPKYGDLFPDLFKIRKPKGDRGLSSKEVGDLFDTLEGKKALKPERDFLDRSEMGKLGGDISDEIEKQARELTGRRKSKGGSADKIAEDLLKGAQAKKKKQKDDGASALGELVSGGSGGGQSSVLVSGGRQTGRQIAKDLEETLGGDLPTPKGFKSPAGAGFGVGSISKILSSAVPKSSARESTAIKEIISTVSRQSQGRRSRVGLNLKDLVGGQIKIDTGLDTRTSLTTRQRSGQSFKLGSIQNFKFDVAQSFKLEQVARQQFKFNSAQSFKQSSAFDFAKAFKFKFDFDTTIPKPRRPTPDVILPAGAGFRFGKKKGKGGTSAELRSYLASSLPLAFLGSDSKFARDFEKQFGKFY